MFIKKKKTDLAFFIFNTFPKLSKYDFIFSKFLKKKSQSTVVCRLRADPLSHFFEISQQLSLHLFVHLSSPLLSSIRRHPTKENGVHVHAWQ